MTVSNRYRPVVGCAVSPYSNLSLYYLLNFGEMGRFALSEARETLETNLSKAL